jgi:acetyl-CoA carboxylase biotin carboxyl carrier protein
MSDELRNVQRLLEAFEKSDWTSVHLKVGDLEVSISVDPDGVAPAPVLGAAPVARPPVAPAPVQNVPAAAPVATPVVTEVPAPTPAESTAERSGAAILAPSPGIFWRSPSPGAPPFVEVGQHVEPETTVCIVELMKLMNNVLAGVTGTVSAILVANGEAVEMGQPILLVRES